MIIILYCIHLSLLKHLYIRYLYINIRLLSELSNSEIKEIIIYSLELYYNSIYLGTSKRYVKELKSNFNKMQVYTAIPMTNKEILKMYQTKKER